MGICECDNPKPTENMHNNFDGERIPNKQNMQRTNMQNTQDKKSNGNEMATANKSISVDIIINARKSICKIIRKSIDGILYGTGFFMKVSDTEKYLITNNHCISRKNINDDIKIEIYNQKTMKLNLSNRKIKYFSEPKDDITIIEIKDNDEIYNDILFLDYDSNYTKGFKNMYHNVPIFLIQHPNGESAECGIGKIVNIYGFEFDHDISTEKGASGSPIMLYTKNINSIQVIGIHKKANFAKKLNSGTFIGKIFENENNYILKNNNNYIIAEIDIKDNDINQNIRILNSYECFERQYCYGMKKELMNEEQIKQCEIRINDKLIPFNYFFKFPKKGKYTFKYSFHKYLTKTNHMFYECSSITNINLSNLNTKNVTNMSHMFFACSLTNIDLSNFNTQNVTDMSYMFSHCSSLTNINLSNFNTQNVTNMSDMFHGCTSLTNINLSNFNTQNVTNMGYMFSFCSSLTNIDLSNFNTQNVTNMEKMFHKCSSLRNLNLSNFNTQNVTDMSWMFYDCSSLIRINLSNFNTQNVTCMSWMFDGCSSLTKMNIITNDKNIINQFCKDKKK